MENNAIKPKGKTVLLINFSSIIILVVVFEILKNSGQNNLLLVAEAALLAIAITSFIYAFIKTGLFKFTHTNFSKLDEREVKIIGNALRYSYSLFTIAVLVIIYLYAILENGPIDVVIAAGFLYFAHTLPAAIILWTEKIK